MKLRQLPAIMALSPAEKVDLIHDLWESISSHAEQAEVSDEEKKLLDERWERHLANPDAALSIDQVRAILAARRK